MSPKYACPNCDGKGYELYWRHSYNCDGSCGSGDCPVGDFRTCGTCNGTRYVTEECGTAEIVEPSTLYENQYLSILSDGTMSISDGVGYVDTLSADEVEKIYNILDILRMQLRARTEQNES